MVVGKKYKQTEKMSVVAACGSEWKEDIFVMIPHQQYILLYLFSIKTSVLILYLVLTHAFSFCLSSLFAIPAI